MRGQPELARCVDLVVSKLLKMESVKEEHEEAKEELDDSDKHLRTAFFRPEMVISEARYPFFPSLI